MAETQTLPRCPWCGDDPLYVAYHDTEWGVPQRDPRALWEKLMLEGFQAGLSWITVLRKRENFREEFEGFDPERVANWGEAQVESALKNPGIIRHRGKIEATIAGARAYLDLQSEQGFDKFLWDFVGGTPIQNNFATMADAQTQSPESIAMSKALKKRGFKFCGPTITYSFMDSMGMMNNHLTSCHRHKAVIGL